MAAAGRRGRLGGEPVSEEGVAAAVTAARTEGAKQTEIESQPPPEPNETEEPGAPVISLVEWAAGENVNRYAIARLGHMETRPRTRNQWAGLYKAILGFGQGNWGEYKKSKGLS